MGSDNFEKNKVLVVDDESITRTMMRVMLESKGYKVVEAENWKEAVFIVIDDTNEGIISILMDINMPELNWIEATETIRKFVRHNSLLIIWLWWRIDDEKSALKSWMNHFFVKSDTDFDLIYKLIEDKKRKLII